MEERPADATSTAVRATTLLGTLAGAAVAVAVDPSLPLPAAAAAGVLPPLAVGLLLELTARRPLLGAVTAAEARERRATGSERAVRDLLDLDARLEAALALAETEPEVLELVGWGLSRLFPEHRCAILLAPPDARHVCWRVPVEPDGLGEPADLGRGDRCTALATGRTVWSAATTEPDSCAHLRPGADDPDAGWVRSSLCIPFAPVGVLHAEGPPGDDVDAVSRQLAEALARRAGRRLEGLRAARVTTGHVALDPLTGLPNHTAAHRSMRDLLATGRSLAVALCDLDAFGAYNSEEGTEAGDRVLRLFAEVLGATLRPDDLVARYAGDRFLAVFPDCSAENAAAAMERVRERLVLALASQEMARITVSVGVGEARPGAAAEEVVEDADVALLVAKAEGGNRVRSARFDQATSS